jgi:hypothetical protein
VADECVGWSQSLAQEASASVTPAQTQPGFGDRDDRLVPADRHARRDQRDSADKIEPALAAEPTEKMEATEATEPIERTDPAEPMHRIEPAEPMDKIDPLDPMLRSEPAEPADRGELSVFPMLRFSHPWPRSAAIADVAGVHTSAMIESLRHYRGEHDRYFPGDYHRGCSVRS